MGSKLSLLVIFTIIVLCVFMVHLLEATHIASRDIVAEEEKEEDDDDDEQKVGRWRANTTAAAAAAVATVTLPWLDEVAGGGERWPEGRSRRPRESGCRYRPWICRAGLPPFTPRLCCRNRCVDVRSDPNNCGFCGIRCPFRWRCCGGFCRNVMISLFHCGECNRRCPFGSFCLYGLCSYIEPLPPLPLPPYPFPPPPPLVRPPALD